VTDGLAHAAAPGPAGRARACKREPLLRRMPVRRRAPASTVGLQTKVREDLLDHRLLQDRRDDLQLAPAVRAVLHVDLESEASAKTYLYSSYVAVETRLSSLAQLSRTGRWCAQGASHSAGGAACTGGSRSCGTTCGTTSARSLALGATTPWFAQRGSAHFAQRSYADTKRIRCSLGLRTRAARRCMNSSGDNLAGRALAELGPFGWRGLQVQAAASSGLSTRASS